MTYQRLLNDEALKTATSVELLHAIDHLAGMLSIDLPDAVSRDYPTLILDLTEGGAP